MVQEGMWRETGYVCSESGSPFSRYGVRWILNNEWDTYKGYVIRAFTSLVFLEKFVTGRATQVSDHVLEGRLNCPYCASSNSSKLFSKIFSFLYWSKKALRCINLSNWCSMRLNSWGKRQSMFSTIIVRILHTEPTLVWLASIKPLTRWFVET